MKSYLFNTQHHLDSHYCVPETVLNTSHALSHLIFQHPRRKALMLLMLCNEEADTQRHYLESAKSTVTCFHDEINWAPAGAELYLSLHVCSHSQLT